MARKSNTASNPKMNSLAAMKEWGSLNILGLSVLGTLASAFLWAWCSDPTLVVNACPATAPNPQVKIVSLDPFIAHITDFVSKSERKYLIALGTPLLSRSTYVDDSGSQSSSDYRTSSTAFLPPSDPCVARIITRSADFQGYVSPSDINVQLTAYQPGQQYKHHYDWFTDVPGTPARTKNTLSTFFAILHARCEDCGTEFPFINRTARGKHDARWCDLIDCEKEVLTTRNVEGSALFWVNLDAQGRGRPDTLHSGLPAKGGEKIGLNIWTDLEVQEVWERGVFGASLKPPVGLGR